MATTAPAPVVTRQIYIPPRNMKQQVALVSPVGLNPHSQGERIVSVNTVMRQERLGLVRNLPPSTASHNYNWVRTIIGGNRKS
jgi:hypothetical protein